MNDNWKWVHVASHNIENLPRMRHEVIRYKTKDDVMCALIGMLILS